MDYDLIKRTLFMLKNKMPTDTPPFQNYERAIAPSLCSLASKKNLPSSRYFRIFSGNKLKKKAKIIGTFPLTLIVNSP
jgi:hypothetical protein